MFIKTYHEKKLTPIAYSQTLAGAKFALSELRYKHRDLRGTRFYFKYEEDGLGRENYQIYFENTPEESGLSGTALYTMRACFTTEAQTMVRCHRVLIEKEWNIQEEPVPMQAVG